MFEKITAAPADPILGLADLFKKDRRDNKINLGIGVYKNEKGETPILESVAQAQRLLLNSETTKNYLSIDGLATFTRSTQHLLFGSSNSVIERARSAQTPGGTGALRIAADFIVKQAGAKRVWVSNPSWPNHKNIFSAAGLEVHEYTYYDAEKHALDFDGLLDSLKTGAQAGDVVLFHGCCHNPTGIDPTEKQWRDLADLSASKGWLPLFDFAYQGFAKGLEEDAQGLRIFADKHQELIVCSSYSKNFGLYNERVGACTLVAATSKNAEDALSQMKAIIRANYSNPPAHGAAVVATILNDRELYELWKGELTEMRERIQRMRQLFVKTLKAKGAGDFSFIEKQNGMFSFSGLTEKQVLQLRDPELRDRFAVYAVNSGRVNVAGMTTSNMAALCEAIVAVLCSET
ncbi:amino acid aminotransferase [Candidatus Fukatsuia symbiotica]|uniref:Aminotransferase n=1 Tax=Candidatus Fukatsuia symbiotica TaxID=1878942 RepID=A0A2U8I6K0_9GAMM|nr:amino acid aminotransferase [Candidatus Fukatsuia symbiotica]AWK14727.1 aromatic amino acid aminotransferase [Candidatus Fukatsuia symbiotica]MEA9445057.1 amino acid aminotransferase [Candidatus Fukatsuia symbiotica]